MDHFAGLDVSVKETSICVVDDTGRIVREVKVASEPVAYRQACFGKSTEKPLRQRPSFQSNPLEVIAGVRQLCRDTAHAGGVEGTDQQDRRPGLCENIPELIMHRIAFSILAHLGRSLSVRLSSPRSSRTGRRRQPAAGSQGRSPASCVNNSRSWGLGYCRSGRGDRLSRCLCRQCCSSSCCMLHRPPPERPCRHAGCR